MRFSTDNKILVWLVAAMTVTVVTALVIVRAGLGNLHRTISGVFA